MSYRVNSRMSQLLAESQGGVLKVVHSVADTLHGLQRETESLRTMKQISKGCSELRIDMGDFENGTAFANYSLFAVGLDSVNPDEDGYTLTHSGMQFTTKDRDQDQSENCATYYQGPWWYRNCHTSNLNRQYLRGGHTSYADGVDRLAVLPQVLRDEGPALQKRRL
ncbi:hypothetical protein CRUP_029733 [Coryphaenoides rupestris]|nr:hypothetical protein CRUP_029733 [Coryphaenoides rupestris]